MIGFKRLPSHSYPTIVFNIAARLYGYLVGKNGFAKLIGFARPQATVFATLDKRPCIGKVQDRIR